MMSGASARSSRSPGAPLSFRSNGASSSLGYCVDAMDEETDLRPDESIRSAHSASGESPSFTQRSAAALPLPSLRDTFSLMSCPCHDAVLIKPRCCVLI